ncbi:class I SAM-dependent methyltransferase [Janthinobacterium sp. 17J80-10]|uniref:methyltransferase n=1 Tax=Janthinobacterium sp. 17J80-10 TaxID=2497863 RepID=UPI0010056E0E|nr:class I SAM-dependent methyltransferase [Janthinobacterium sp. 17J80-10]QAU32988.1 class I SAM-dependent methyltransferase [Janthinobacterium sp. 17J80-10]
MPPSSPLPDNAPAGAADSPPVIHWTEAGEARSARWRAEGSTAPPKRVVVGDDTLGADAAYRLACEGTAILWRGDFQNARQLLQALARRADGKGRRKSGKPGKDAATVSGPADAFHLHRQAQAQRARVLGSLLLPFEADYGIPLRRAPDVRQACHEAYGENAVAFVASLRELQGIIGAHEWRKKGVEIPALGARIHPHYGVFSPVRGEYLDLVAQALQTTSPPPLAFDIGTGTGVLAALLAQRGIERVVATDCAPRALACARANLALLNLSDRVQVAEADLFPEGRAPLVVCNPPWVPARPSSAIEQAVYDPDSRMLRGFLDGVAAHLTPGGEAWLILSDLAEHLGLRSREQLLAMIEAAGLSVSGRLDARPHHAKASDPNDPLHAARAAEVTSLWRLQATPAAP